MDLMLRYVSPYKKRVYVGLMIKMLATVAELIIPYILSHILDNVVPKESISEILLFGAMMLGCATIALVGNITANRMASKVAMMSSEKIRNDLFAKVMYLSASQSDKFTIPSLESRLTSDTYNVHNFLGMIQRIGVRAPILLVGGIGITLILDARLSLVMIAILPFISASVYIISKRGIPMYKQTQRSTDKMVRIVREDSQGIRVIKALSKTEYEKTRFNEANEELSKSEQRAGINMAGTSPSVNLFLNIGLVGVIIVGAYLVGRGEIKPGKIIAFMQYFTLISMGMMSVTRVFVMFTKSAASAGRIDDVLKSVPDLAVIEDTGARPTEKDSFIEFSNVSFSYTGKHDNLSNISFSLKKGESLGIIGATGSGKSTLIKLIMRLYDAKSGNIFIGGRDIRTIKENELHSMFGVVFQNDFVYADTIAENIRFGRDLSDEEMINAAKIAQAHDFISDTKEGYERMLSTGGTNVSGGQRQRILISRAVAGKPDILILDDASSALDYKTDAALRTAISDNFKDTTTIVVAHRVSSVKSCDKIIMLENGKIDGIGTHEELMESCPGYAEISRSQMGGAFLE